MNKVQATFVRSYKSKKGNTTFVYNVSGNEANLAKYKQIQGDFYREDETSKKPLFFTTRFVGDNVSLIITPNDKIVPDMSEFDKASSLANQYGGNLGQALASAAANKLMGGNNQPQQTAPVAIEQVSPEDIDA